MADFGQTKILEGSYNSASGTRAWAAPEQSTSNYKSAVDLWGAGCVVYFLLTSLNPFLSYNDNSPIAMVEKYTFPAWPRLLRDKFQLHRTRRIPGDQIIARGVTIEANDFLSNLIVRSPTGRMSAHAALQHAWICDTTPLESALRQGDLPLSRLLAGHDHRYSQAWADPLPERVSQVILRFAAAHGHRRLVTRAFRALRGWEIQDLLFGPRLMDWPKTPCALIGAAEGGHLDIVNLLLQRATHHKWERSGNVLLQALQAAVQAGHKQIESVLLPLVTPAMFGCHEWCRMVAGHMDLTMLITTIEQYKKKSTTKSGLVRVDVDSFGYRVFFSTMLTSAMEMGNIENIKHLLSDPPAREMLVKANIVQEAARIGRRDVVQLLVDSYTKELGITTVVIGEVLDTAVGEGHLEVVQYLLTRRILPCRQTIETAVLKNNKAIVQLLIKALIQAGSPESIEAGLERAMRAIPLCDVGLLRWLDNTPSQLNLANITGVTSSRGINVSDAAYGGDLGVVRYLLENKEPYFGRTPLRSMALSGAIRGGHRHIVQDLCVRRVDLIAREPWRIGAKNGQAAILELLLQYGSPFRGTLDQALGLAAKAGHLDVVMLLLHNGALWTGPCAPVINGVLAAFGHRGGVLPEIGAPASRRT